MAKKCQKLEGFFLNCQKLSFFQKNYHWQFFFKTMEIFGNFWTVKWQFSGGLVMNHLCSAVVFFVQRFVVFYLYIYNQSSTYESISAYMFDYLSLVSQLLIVYLLSHRIARGETPSKRQRTVRWNLITLFICFFVYFMLINVYSRAAYS